MQDHENSMGNLIFGANVEIFQNLLKSTENSGKQNHTVVVRLLVIEMEATGAC